MPILANITEFGRTPLFSREELGCGGRRHRAVLLRGLSGHECRRARDLPGDPPRRHAARHARAHADARRAVHVTWTTKPSSSSWIGCSPPVRAALSGKEIGGPVGRAAGNTALCTVGLTGNDLHYRGYDILEIAERCEFEEIAYLLIHERWPKRAELAAYKARLQRWRELPAALRTALELLPAPSHPMDVLRTGVSVLGCLEPEPAQHAAEAARELADRLLGALPSMLCYWYHYSHSGRRIETEHRR